MNHTFNLGSYRRKAFRNKNYSNSSFKDMTFTLCTFVNCDFTGAEFHSNCLFNHCTFKNCIWFGVDEEIGDKYINNTFVKDVDKITTSDYMNRTMYLDNGVIKRVSL